MKCFTPYPPPFDQMKRDCTPDTQTKCTQDKYSEFEPSLLEEMRSFIILIFMGVYAQTYLGGTLEVIDFNNQCAIWSDANHGCTGHSAFFAQLDGDDCSSKHLSGTILDTKVFTKSQSWTKWMVRRKGIPCSAWRLAARKITRRLCGLRWNRGAESPSTDREISRPVY